MSGFERELTEKQQFYLYMYQLLPNLELIRPMWEKYQLEKEDETRKYHMNISPFREHPCCDNCIINQIAGIDYDMYLMYMQKRKSWLGSIKMVGHYDFICKYTRPKSEIKNTSNYFYTILNEKQKKLLPLQKVSVLNRVIKSLLSDKKHYEISYEERFGGEIVYLMSLYKHYTNNKILHRYPLAIDSEGTLMRFE